MGVDIKLRLRRNRKSESIRGLLQENRVEPEHLIAPLFVVDGREVCQSIPSMPGQYRLSPDLIVREAYELYERGIRCVSLFPVMANDLKDSTASESANPQGFYPQTILRLKEALPEMAIMSDVAMDPYSSDGHDGLVCPKSGWIKNDESLEILGQMALVQAQAGSDLLGPSNMMDGRVEFLRKILDDHGFHGVSIMSYTAKYASSFYGPFRDALDSTPKKGDKKTYQMNPANIKEALREMERDHRAGADILMVKPGLAYLDVVRAMAERSHLPLAVYNVSGEYAMVKAAHEKGWIDGEKVMMEILIAFKRAGADMILTYFAKEAAEVLK